MADEIMGIVLIKVMHHIHVGIPMEDLKLVASFAIVVWGQRISEMGC